MLAAGIVAVVAAVLSGITLWLQRENARMRRDIVAYRQITAALMAEEALRQRAEERQVQEWMH